MRVTGPRRKEDNVLRKYAASKTYILLTLIVLGSVAGIGYSVIKLDRENHLASIRHDLEQALYEATDQIQLRFFEAVLVAKNIENMLTVSETVQEQKIARVVEDLQRHNPGVVAVALAPGLQVTHSFPQNSNQRTIGLKYWQVPEQMAAVANAYRRQSPVVDGPVPLVQGGSGYILRYPVFLQRPDLNVGQFWGVISIVVKADGLFNAQRSDFSSPDKYEFTLREIDMSDISAADTRRETEILGETSVVTEFTMLGSAWQASARPAGGWPAYSPQSRYLLGTALVLAIVLIGVLWVVRILAAKTENARALLAEAIGCIDEGFVAFDDKERLMLVNQKYLDYHSEIAEFVVPGMTMTALLKSLEHAPPPVCPYRKRGRVDCRTFAKFPQSGRVVPSGGAR